MGENEKADSAVKRRRGRLSVETYTVRVLMKMGRTLTPKEKRALREWRLEHVPVLDAAARLIAAANEED